MGDNGGITITATLRLKIPTLDRETIFRLQTDWNIDRRSGAEITADLTYGHVLVRKPTTGDLAVYHVENFRIIRYTISQQDWGNVQTDDYIEVMKYGYGLRFEYVFVDSALNAYILTKFRAMYSELIRKKFRDIPY